LADVQVNVVALVRLCVPIAPSSNWLVDTQDIGVIAMKNLLLGAVLGFGFVLAVVLSGRV